MDMRYASLTLCMHVLIIMCTFGTNMVMARRDLEDKMNKDQGNFEPETQNKRGTSALRLHSMDGVNVHDDGDTKHVGASRHQHDHMSHMSPSLNVFLVEKDLRVGRVMPIYFPNIDPSSGPRFLPRQQADFIPFSSDKLQYLLRFFSFSKGSPQAKMVRNTLELCELDPVHGESKTCATSLESMLDFARTVFGEGAQFRAVSTIHHKKQNSKSQTHQVLDNYTILNITDLSANEIVPCHTMPYPYAVYFCHHLASKNKVFKVAVIGESGDDEVDAVVVCHMDTSAWNPDHLSFRALGIKPGTDPVCHFFPADHLVWIPSSPSY